MTLRYLLTILISIAFLAPPGVHAAGHHLNPLLVTEWVFTPDLDDYEPVTVLRDSMFGGHSDRCCTAFLAHDQAPPCLPETPCATPCSDPHSVPLHPGRRHTPAPAVLYHNLL